jgi:hypothetical protein
VKLIGASVFRGTHLLMVAALLALTAAGVSFLFSRNDPVVDGRRLSVSVMDLLNPNSDTYASSSDVIAELGTVAVPYLGLQMKRGESSFERLANRFGLPVPAHRTAYGRQLAACRAVKILGTNAAPLRNDLLPLAQSRVGSVRLAALEALFVTSRFADIYSLVTNVIATDRFIDCRLSAIQYALAAGQDPAAVLSLAIENIGKGTSFKSETIRKFAAELKTMPVPEDVLETIYERYSLSADTDVRRFIALAIPNSLDARAKAHEILGRLMADTNSSVASAATNAWRSLRERP